MMENGTKKKQWIPFVIGLVTALGVGVGVFVVAKLTGAESTAGRVTGGTSGGVVAVLVCVCAAAAARRRRSEKK